MTARRPVQIGDVFAVVRSRLVPPPSIPLPSGDATLFGRVVSTEAIVGPRHGCNLVYVYRPGADLSRDQLLLRPILTTHAPWARRYFEYVRSEPLLPGDFFECHSFRDARGQLYDEESRPLDEARGPVGEWCLYDRVEAIDEAIARALA